MYSYARSGKLVDEEAQSIMSLLKGTWQSSRDHVSQAVRGKALNWLEMRMSGRSEESEKSCLRMQVM